MEHRPSIDTQRVRFLFWIETGWARTLPQISNVNNRPYQFQCYLYKSTVLAHLIPVFMCMSNRHNPHWLQRNLIILTSRWIHIKTNENWILGNICWCRQKAHSLAAQIYMPMFISISAIIIIIVKIIIKILFLCIQMIVDVNAFQSDSVAKHAGKASINNNEILYIQLYYMHNVCWKFNCLFRKSMLSARQSQWNENVSIKESVWHEKLLSHFSYSWLGILMIW